MPVSPSTGTRLTGGRVTHWVVITGFDDENVYIHDPDVASHKRDKSRARHLRIERAESLRMIRHGNEAYHCLLTVERPASETRTDTLSRASTIGRKRP